MRKVRLRLIIHGVSKLFLELFAIFPVSLLSLKLYSVLTTPVKIVVCARALLKERRISVNVHLDTLEAHAPKVGLKKNLSTSNKYSLKE